MGYTTIRTEVEKSVATITLTRPEVKNAFNDVMLDELFEAYGGFEADPEVRVVVLTGEGNSFCAGADLNYMKNTINYTFEENVADGMKISDVMERIHRLRKPTVGRVTCKPTVLNFLLVEGKVALCFLHGLVGPEPAATRLTDLVCGSIQPATPSKQTWEGQPRENGSRRFGDVRELSKDEEAIAVCSECRVFSVERPGDRRAVG